MPNMCENRLIVRGDAAEIERMLQFVKSDRTPFDFEKILPIPKRFRNRKRITQKLVNQEISWCVNRWGTKWGGLDAEIFRWEKEIWIDFETAWSPSVPVTGKLAYKFPTLEIMHIYCEPDMDFGGYIHGKGKVIYGVDAGDGKKYRLKGGKWGRKK